MITIKQIAESLNVSPTTVSNVIHGNLTKVSPKTVELITQKLNELDYVPNMGARMLANGESKIIGVFMNSPIDSLNNVEKYSIHSGPFNSAIFSTLEREIRLHGYFMMFYVSKNVEEILTIHHSWNIDGLVVWGIGQDDSIMLKRKTQKPVVFIDGYFGEGEEVSNIGLDDRRGGYLAAQYLIENGHRKIAFISDTNPPVGVDYERMCGYRDALSEAGVSWNPKHHIGISNNKDQRFKHYEGLYSRLDEFTALFFDSDYYAVEAMNYLLDRKVQIPEDISIMGFDDNLLAQVIRPRLTTIRQDVPQKAVQAIKHLTELIADPMKGPKNIVLPISLIVRDSVKNIS